MASDLVVELLEHLQLRPACKAFEIELHSVARRRPRHTRDRLGQPLEELLELEAVEAERRAVGAEPGQRLHIGACSDADREDGELLGIDEVDYALARALDVVGWRTVGHEDQPWLVVEDT